jgi:putative ABC transport system ATP-binding protein
VVVVLVVLVEQEEQEELVVLVLAAMVVIEAEATSCPGMEGSCMNKIELSEITKVYKRGIEELHILKKISLTVAEGEFVAIVGPSGSGKSTLMNTIGLLDIPTSGSYILDGVSTENLSDNQLAELRNQKIGFIFQQFNLLPRLTALQNVELPMIYAGLSKKERMEKSQHVLSMLGMGTRGNHKPSELSGGQQQRVAIARALAISPSMLLADEPTGALDSKTGTEVMELMIELNEQGNTIILITHDPEIARISKRMVTIRDGFIIGDERILAQHSLQQEVIV